MSSSFVILITVTVYFSAAYCDTFPTIKVNSGDIKPIEKNGSRINEKDIFWKNLTLSRHKSTKMEEARNFISANSDVNKRASRLLGSLAFLAGLGFGGLATAASSTVKNFAKQPEASFTLNLGPARNSPYFAGYYNPYSLLPHPFFYHGPFTFLPMLDPAKPQTSSHNDLTPQVISVFDNRRPIDSVDNNEEYAEEEKKYDNDKSAVNGEDEPDGRAELRAEANRNAEEKTKTRGCKEDQQRYNHFFEGSERGSLRTREHEKLNSRATNMTDVSPTQDITQATTMTTIANLPVTLNVTQNDRHISNHTEYPYFPGYFGGHPKDVNYVDLTTDSDIYRYHGQDQISYNLPYGQPAHFYHDNKYNVHSNPHINPYFPGSFPSDQINGHVSADFSNRLYNPEYQPPYVDGFRPVK